MDEWIDYLFEDQETGERFFVELKADEPIKAFWDIAREYFEDPQLVCIMSNEDADFIGYDTY